LKQKLEIEKEKEKNASQKGSRFLIDENFLQNQV
jgi:hypothetical protein